MHSADYHFSILTLRTRKPQSFITCHLASVGGQGGGRGEERKNKNKKTNPKVKRGIIKTSLNHRVFQGDLQAKSGVSNPALAFRCHSFPNSLFAKEGQKELLVSSAGR